MTRLLSASCWFVFAALSALAWRWIGTPWWLYAAATVFSIWRIYVVLNCRRCC